MKSSIVSALLGAAMLVQAHPGQSQAEMLKEVQERNAYLNTHKRSLAHCADKLKARGNDAIMHARRSAKVDALRKKRSISQESPFLKARDLEDVLNKNHKSNLTGVTPDTDADIIFAGNNSCILNPEVTEGPYYVSGEFVREDIKDGQQGVELTVDMQIIDVDTCEPVPEVYLEAWHCNSTGVYSGVINPTNGNPNDTSNLEKTFLRGIQKSDEDGVVSFDTLFPGHYTGRTAHIHVMTHANATLGSNSTLSSQGRITHVGQVYFDQDLITAVEATPIYTTNQQILTLNSNDTILAQAAEEVDPVMEYVLLGDNIEDGIFAWIAFGIDTGANYTVTPAVWYQEDGSEINPDA